MKEDLDIELQPDKNAEEGRLRMRENQIELISKSMR